MKHDLPRDTGSDYVDESNNKPGLLPKTTQLAEAWIAQNILYSLRPESGLRMWVTKAFIAGYGAKSAEYVHEIARLQQVIEHQRQEIGKLQKHLAEDLPFMEFRKQPDPSPASGEFARAFSGASVADGAEMAAGADLGGETGAGGSAEAGTAEVASTGEKSDIEEGAQRYFDEFGRKQAEQQKNRMFAHIIAELDANPYGALAVAITTVVAAHATVPIFSNEKD